MIHVEVKAKQTDGSFGIPIPIWNALSMMH
jgi:hypothetical protein